MNPEQAAPKRRIHTISQLTAIIKDLLENALPFVWVSGEISNLHAPASGHYYFTLKDEHAQVRAVMFKGHVRGLNFAPTDGMHVVCLGRVAVYEPQGAYQILIEHMDPAGMGAFALAFEQLKAKLAEEGLFDAVHKKPLPFLPRTIAVVTSPTGAVIHDVLRVLGRRFPNVHVQVWPVKVQGQDAPAQIVETLADVNIRGQADVIIVARGGGSLEDLAAFNSESVARAIFSSVIPVVSAVGHETDFTIADFVADLRAPTPSAAAEQVMPEKQGLQFWQREMAARLRQSMDRRLRLEGDQLLRLFQRLPPPRRQIDDWRLRLDDWSQRSHHRLLGVLEQRAERLFGLNHRLNHSSPLNIISKHKATLEYLGSRLDARTAKDLSAAKARLDQAGARLTALNPTAILERGYSITRTLPGLGVLTKASQSAPGNQVEVTLSSGKLVCVVQDVKKGAGS